jgi:hypothetical protein
MLDKAKGVLAYTKWALRLFDAPNRNGVVYGYGPDLWPNGGADGHIWYCGRCRESDDGIVTLFDAFEAAEDHADTHDGVGTYQGKGR